MNFYLRKQGRYNKSGTKSYSYGFIIIKMAPKFFLPKKRTY